MVHVVVIGAGFAGVGAVQSLLSHAGQHNMKVTLIEAEKRIGGRVCTHEVGGCGYVELGANWYHGLRGNPVYQYALKHKLHDKIKNRSKYGGLQYLQEGGSGVLSDAQLTQCRRGMQVYRQGLNKAYELGMKAAKGKGSDQDGVSIQDVLVETWRKEQKAPIPERSSPQQHERYTLAQQGWWWRERLQRSMDGCNTTSDMSLDNYVYYDELDYENEPVDCGYQTVVEHMFAGCVATAGDALDVRLGRVVKEVDWQESEGGGVRVKCDSGEVIQADYVIVTVSLGVLKANHREMFRPPLPESKLTAMNNLSMGITNKVFIDFSEQANGSFEAGPEPLQPTQYRQQGQSNIVEQLKSMLSIHKGVEQQLLQALNKRSDRDFGFLWPLDQQECAMLSGNANVSQSSTRSPYQLHQQQETESTKTEVDQDAYRYHSDVNCWFRNVYAMSFWSLDFLGSNSRGRNAALLSKGKLNETVIPLTMAVQPQVNNAQNQDHVGCEFEAQNSQIANCQHTLPPYEQRKSKNDAQLHVKQFNPTAVIWVTGDEALKMEDQTDEQLQLDVGKLLKLFPQIQAATGLTNTPRVYATRWGRHPHFRGSYSYIKQGGRGDDIDTLAQPLYSNLQQQNNADTAVENDDIKGVSGYSSGRSQPVVLFAGEATSKPHFGAVNGAYESGVREAERILKLLNKQNR